MSLRRELGRRNFKRLTKVEARPLIILAPMAPILFVFDIQDTEGSPVPSSLLGPPDTKGPLLERIYENTLHNCRIQGISVHETILNSAAADSAGRITPALRKKYNELNLTKDASYLILIDKAGSLKEKYAALVYELGHIFCGHLGIGRHAWWPERKELDITGETLEAESVAYLVCKRSGLLVISKKYLETYVDNERVIPVFSLNAVLQAVNYVEEMGKLPWKQPRKQSRY